MENLYNFHNPRKSAASINIQLSFMKQPWGNCGRLSLTHNTPEDVKSLLQKICGSFSMKMA